MSRFVEPITLTGARWVLLEPLTEDHIAEVASAADDGDGGSLWFTTAPSAQTADGWVHRLLDIQAGDQGVTYVVRRLADGVLVGSSSFFHVDAPTADSRSDTPGIRVRSAGPGSTPRPNC